MSRAILLRLFFVLALLLGNLALWGSSQATGASLPRKACGMGNSSGYHCVADSECGQGHECCDNNCDCGDC